jgi:hypothetical protein
MEIRGAASERASKVEPINWAEKTDLNERRVPQERAPKGGTGGGVETPVESVNGDRVTLSDDLFPEVDIVDEHGKLLDALQDNHAGASGVESKAGHVQDGSSAAHSPKSLDKPGTTIDAAPTATEVALTPELELVPAGASQHAPIGARVNAGGGMFSQPGELAQPKPISDWSNAELMNRKYQLSLSQVASEADCVELVKVQSELMARRGGVMSAPEAGASVPEAKLSVPEKLAPVIETAPGPTAVVETAPSGQSFSSTLGRGVGGGFAFLGVFGGGLQVGHGLDLVRNGEYLDGSVTMMSGFSNASAGTAALLWNNPAANTFAMRAGGVGAVLDGGLNLYNGIQSGDDVKILDGGVKTSLGATMLYGGTTGLYAGSAYAGWSVGRFIGGCEVSQGRTVDDAVTDFFYNALYA